MKIEKVIHALTILQKAGVKDINFNMVDITNGNETERFIDEEKGLIFLGQFD